MGVNKVLLTGAAGYIASQLLPTFRERYEMVLVDVKEENRRGKRVDGIAVADLINSDRDSYAHLFKDIDAVVHLGYRRHSGHPVEHYFDEKANVEMAYNVFRSAYDSGIPRVAVASSNLATSWYEHALVHADKMDTVDAAVRPLSDSFYGWAKATVEHMGFLFACGAMGVEGNEGVGHHTDGLRHAGRKMGVVMVRIGWPWELNVSQYGGNTAAYKRDLGAYVSPSDLTQLFVRAIETPDLENEHGVPWHVVYGISNNARAFWSLANARQVLGYQPEDDSEVKYADDIRRFLIGEGTTGGVGRVGTA